MPASHNHICCGLRAAWSVPDRCNHRKRLLLALFDYCGKSSCFDISVEGVSVILFTPAIAGSNGER